MSFPANVYPTPDGLVLIAKAQQGKQLELTRMRIGDGVLPGGMPWLQNAMLSPKMELPLARLDLLAGGVMSAVGYLSNDSVIAAFKWRELGLYAKDPDTGAEKLYCYGNAGESGETIPAAGTNILERFEAINLAGAPAESFAAVIDQSLVFASVAELQDLAGPGRTTETVVGAYAAAEAATPTPVIVNLPAANWVTQVGLPTQTISLPGMVPEDLIVSCLPETLTLAQAKAIGKAVIMLRNQQVGSVDVVCLGTAPAIDVPFAVLWYGGGS